jgi:hypothetical protein
MMTERRVIRMVKKIRRFCERNNISVCANYIINMGESDPEKMLIPKRFAEQGEGDGFVVSCHFNPAKPFSFSNN